MKRMRSVVSLAILSAALSATSCNDPPPPAPAPLPMVKEDPSPPLSVEDQAALDADLAEARKAVDEAKAVAAQGDAEHKAKSGSGVDSWIRAAKLYGNAHRRMQRWVEPSALKVTEIQLENRLAPVVKEVDGWVASAAQLSGKVQMVR